MLGILVGHQAVYERAAVGDEHAPMTLAGQSWLPSTPLLLLAFTFLAFLAVLVSRLKPNMALTPRLVLLAQTSVFVLVEVADRVVNNCCPYPAWHVAVLGVLAQAVPAFIVFLLLAILGRAALESSLSYSVAPTAHNWKAPALPIPRVTQLKSLTDLSLFPARAPPA